MTKLFAMTTEAARLTWSQRHSGLQGVPPGSAGLRVEASGGGVPRLEQAAAPLVLAEQTDYAVLLQSRNGQPVRLVHRDPTVLAGLTAADGGRLWHGVVNFGTQVGRSRFEVRSGARLLWAFSVEVVPTKLDYRDDFTALCADLEGLGQALALAYLQPAEHAAAPQAARAALELEWALALRALAGRLEAALHYVARQPHRALEPLPAWQRADRATHPDARLRRALTQGAGRGPFVAAGALPLRTLLPAQVRVPTLDTPEHRWLAAALERLRRRLARLRQVPAPRTRRAAAVQAELETLDASLERLRRLAPLQAAEGARPVVVPPRLLAAPGYREAYHAFAQLEQGLALGTGSLGVALKDLHRLYEYWCFLTVAVRAAALLGQAPPRLTVDARGLWVGLAAGQVVAIGRPRAGRPWATLAFNPRLAGARYLVPQRPDLLLTVHAPGREPVAYVLDAKYRLDTSPAYQRRYGMPGPPAEVLGDLHRYRDAIRDARTGARAVRQVVALYPYREAQPGQAAASRLVRFLGEGGIGALPLLPGATAALDAWLRSVLSPQGSASVGP